MNLEDVSITCATATMADAKTATFVYVLVSRTSIASKTFRYINIVESIWLSEDSARKALAEFTKQQKDSLECAYVNRVPANSRDEMNSIYGLSSTIAQVHFAQPAMTNPSGSSESSRRAAHIDP